MSTNSEDNPFKAMDRMYRVQRYFYDLTRRYYLLGRDELLTKMDIRPGERVLEIGCGTARNLIILSRNNPGGLFYGLDASAAMLETARARSESAGAKNIVLKNALADDFTYQGTFGIDQPFDKIFFSYSISMIPTWRESIENALKNLKPGGTLFIVDFYDQKELPALFRRMLRWWLSKFHVRFWPDLIPYLESLNNSGKYDVTVIPLFRRYSFIVSVRSLDFSS